MPVQFIGFVAVSVVSIIVLAVKYHNAQAALTAVKAEVAKIESEVKNEVQVFVASASLSIVARIKALL